MAEARQESTWNQTATICAAVTNANPFRSGKPASPDQFNPFARKAAAAVADVLKMPFKLMRDFFCPTK